MTIDDCIQLCECNWTLLDNGICDQDCNNTKCDFDLIDCFINYNSDTVCYGNETDPNVPCYESWIQDDDQWCDNNCKHWLQCSYDNNVCDGCGGNCAYMKTILIDFVASIYEPSELMTMDELCVRWDEINSLTNFADGYKNCTIMFNDWDENQNGHIGLGEWIEKAITRSNALDFQDSAHWQFRLTQINCSLCLDNQSLHYE